MFRKSNSRFLNKLSTIPHDARLSKPELCLNFIERVPHEKEDDLLLQLKCYTADSRLTIINEVSECVSALARPFNNNGVESLTASIFNQIACSWNTAKATRLKFGKRSS